MTAKISIGKADQAEINGYWLFSPHNSLASTCWHNTVIPTSSSPSKPLPFVKREKQYALVVDEVEWCEVCAVCKVLKPFIEFSAIESIFVQFQYVLNKYGALCAAWGCSLRWENKMPK